MTESDYSVVIHTRRRELKTRVWAAMILAAIAYFLAPGWTPVLWFAAVLGTQALDLALVRPALKPNTDWRPTPTFRVLAIGSAFLAAIVYSGIGAYMWFYGGDAGRLFALMQFAGGLLHVSMHMHQSRALLGAALCAHGAYMLGMPLYDVVVRGEPAMAVVVVAGVLYLAHLGVSVRQASDRHQALRQAECASREAAAQAERASAAKSEFLAVVSHEIRTPMNAVVTAAGLLRGSRLSRAQAEQVDMLVDASEVLLGLLNDVLDFSKIEAGKMTLERIAFDPGEKLESLIRMWRPRAEAKGLTLTLEVRGRLPAMVHGDSLRLQQVLFNLLSNAVKFTDRGGVAVRATWSDSRLLVEVEDTGCGIPQDRLDQVFDSFEQADVGTTRRYGGTGLGLAISRRLAALMEGGLEVESLPGRGSLFRFEGRFPAIAATAPQPTTEAAEAGGLEGLEVLAAEDHPVNRRILALLLEPLGCRLTVVENGAEAVAAASARPFDVILLDMQMPVMDGLDAARAIRSTPGPCRATPIVALTANALDVHRQAWLAVGAAGFLTKPIDAAALAATLAGAARGAPALAATG